MRIRAWIVLAVLALAVPAGAQQASFAVDQGEAPVELETEAGSSVSFDVDVNLTGEGFSCAGDVEAPVNATVEVEVPSSAPDNASVTPADASIGFPIPAGTYHTEAYNQSTTTTIEVETGSGVREDYTASLSLQSVYPGGTYMDCVPQEFPAAESETAQIQLDVLADRAPEEPETDVDEEPEDNTTEPPMNDTPDDGSPDEEEDGIPLPWPLVPASLAALALATRRSKRARGG